MKLFKDLPSTDTPINAENLNQIQDNLVVVSATEPTGDNREKVWMQKGKNLIRGFRAGYGFNSGQYEIATMFSSTEAIDVEVGQTYIFSHSIGHIGGGVHCLDANNNHVETLNQDTITSPFTITNPNCKKIVIVAWDPNNNASVNETWMQLEQGSIATEYEAYIEPKMFVKNDNGMYEKFISKEDTLEVYSTAEKIVGKWTNEGYLYRKVINGTLSSTDETIINLEEKIIPRNFYGDIYNASLKLFIPLNYANVSAPVYTYISNAGANTTINIVASDIFRGCDYMIVIEYLKY